MERLTESHYSEFLVGRLFNGCVILFVAEIESVWFPRDGKKHSLFYLLESSGKITTKYVSLTMKVEEMKIVGEYHV